MNHRGDDLESDDEYLNQDWHDDNEEVEVTVDASATKQERIERPVASKKRSGSAIGEPDDEEIVTTQKKMKTKSPKNLLLEAGKGIADADRGEDILNL